MIDSACVWTEDADGAWETECGHVFEVMTGTPSENDMRFCCYCGGALIEERQ